MTDRFPISRRLRRIITKKAREPMSAHKTRRDILSVAVIDSIAKTIMRIHILQKRRTKDAPSRC